MHISFTAWGWYSELQWGHNQNQHRHQRRRFHPWLTLNTPMARLWYPTAATAVQATPSGSSASRCGGDKAPEVRWGRPRSDRPPRRCSHTCHCHAAFLVGLLSGVCGSFPPSSFQVPRNHYLKTSFHNACLFKIIPEILWTLQAPHKASVGLSGSMEQPQGFRGAGCHHHLDSPNIWTWCLVGETHWEALGGRDLLREACHQWGKHATSVSGRFLPASVLPPAWGPDRILPQL